MGRFEEIFEKSSKQAIADKVKADLQKEQEEFTKISMGHAERLLPSISLSLYRLICHNQATYRNPFPLGDRNGFVLSMSGVKEHYCDNEAHQKILAQVIMDMLNQGDNQAHDLLSQIDGEANVEVQFREYDSFKGSKVYKKLDYVVLFFRFQRKKQLEEEGKRLVLTNNDLQNH